MLVAATVLVAVACRFRRPAAGDRLTGDEGYSWIVGSAPTAAAFLDRLALRSGAVVAYYLHDPKPALDRPVNLGPTLEASTRRPYAVADDDSFCRARHGPGRVVTRVADRIVVRVVR